MLSISCSVNSQCSQSGRLAITADNPAIIKFKFALSMICGSSFFFFRVRLGFGCSGAFTFASAFFGSSISFTVTTPETFSFLVSPAPALVLDPAPAPTNPDLAALNQKIAELLGAVQQHNILTISRETPPQSPGEIAEAYLTNLINGGEKNNA